ncbi:MAG TPA: SRPBCC family protein [Longimicrobium sp.]|nr:SRPBCC family protein [Longimicrobium sp.]
MSPIPTGRIVPTAEGRDLVILRTFRAPIEDVWASITEPERTARWFGPWAGEPGPGKKIRYAMVFEQGGDPAELTQEMTIDACEPPRHLAVSAIDDHGSWFLEAHLSEADGVTELRFVQHLDDKANAGDVGPGWEYYLDNLVASRDGSPRPDFNDYYPAQKAYYLEQAGAGAGSA